MLISWLLQALVLRRFHLGKTLLLFATWLSWFGGIVLAQSDLAFTVMNVALHGVPYLVLLRRYAKGRDAEGGYGRLSWLVLRLGLPGLPAAALGAGLRRGVRLGPAGLARPADALRRGGPRVRRRAAGACWCRCSRCPQTTHYLLDGFIWRTRADPNLLGRLGWASAVRGPLRDRYGARAVSERPPNAKPLVLYVEDDADTFKLAQAAAAGPLRADQRQRPTARPAS